MLHERICSEIRNEIEEQVKMQSNATVILGTQSN